VRPQGDGATTTNIILENKKKVILKRNEVKQIKFNVPLGNEQNIENKKYPNPLNEKNTIDDLKV